MHKAEQPAAVAQPYLPRRPPNPRSPPKWKSPGPKPYPPKTLPPKTPFGGTVALPFWSTDSVMG